MSEMNRQQHELLGGSWSNDAFFGGFISELGGMYMPLKLEQTNGDHASQFVNMLDSQNRRLVNCLQGYVYKDSADTDDEFSVKTFTFQFRGLICSFAGVLAQGPLVVGNNLIWADLTVAPTITIAFGAAWPTTPHLKLGTINMPASGPWLPAALTSNVGSQAGVALGGAVAALRSDFAFGSAASFNIATVPAGSIVLPVSIIVETAFDGTAPTIKVGDPAADDSLFVVGDADLKTIGRYDGTLFKRFSAETMLSATYFANSSGAGAAVILLDQR